MLWHKQFCREKAISITYSECLCVCDLKYPTCKQQCGLSVSTLFPTLSNTPHDFVRNIKRKTCGLIFSTTLCQNCLILRNTLRDPIKSVYRSSSKCTNYSCHIIMKFDFCREIFKTFSNIIFHEDKWGSVGLELLQNDCHERHGHDKGWFTKFWYRAQEPTYWHTSIIHTGSSVILFY